MATLACDHYRVTHQQVVAPARQASASLIVTMPDYSQQQGKEIVADFAHRSKVRYLIVVTEYFCPFYCLLQLDQNTRIDQTSIRGTFLFCKIEQQDSNYVLYAMV